MTTQEAMNRLEAMRRYFILCFMNAANGSTAEKEFSDNIKALDMAWMALNEMEDDGK